MKLRIENLLCHKNLEIDFKEGVNLVTGKNSSGKTSIAMILAAVTSGDQNPLNLSVTQKKSYISDGCTEGSAFMDGVTWNPTRGITSPTQTTPYTRPHAVNLVNFTSPVALKARSEIWEGLFLPKNPRALLKKNWTLSARQLDVVVKKIEDNQGEWSSAQKIYEDQRKEAKRRWNSITGKTFGTKVAAAWVPDGWSIELDGKSEAELQEKITEARDMQTSATAKIVVKMSEVQRARQQRDEVIPQMEKELINLTKKLVQASEKSTDAAEKHAERQEQVIQNRTIKTSMDDFLSRTAPAQCPSCSAPLYVELNGTVLLWETPSQEELDEARAKQSDARAALSVDGPILPMLEETKRNAAERLRRLENGIYAAKQEIVKAKKQCVLADKQPTALDQEMVNSEKNKAENMLDEAKKTLVAFQNYHQAKKEFDNVRHLEYIIQLLGPNGIRSKIMQDVLSRVKVILVRAAEITGWMPVSISMDYAISSGGRPIALTASNEKLKAQWLMQIVVAMLTNSNWLVLDNVDILKDESWDGLVNLVNRLVEKRKGLRLVLCGTSVRKPDALWSVTDLDDSDAATP